MDVKCEAMVDDSIRRYGYVNARACSSVAKWRVDGKALCGAHKNVETRIRPDADVESIVPVSPRLI